LGASLPKMKNIESVTTAELKVLVSKVEVLLGAADDQNMVDLLDDARGTLDALGVLIRKFEIAENIKKYREKNRVKKQL
jgi:hypothetical protein